MSRLATYYTWENTSKDDPDYSEDDKLTRFTCCLGEYKIHLWTNQHDNVLIDYFDNDTDEFNLQIHKNNKPFLLYEDYNNISHITLTFFKDSGGLFVVNLSRDNLIELLDLFCKKFIINSNQNIIYPCSICGILDKWNGPSAKHNNSIRCYQHC